MSARPASKSMKALLSTIVFVVIWHVLVQEPGRSWMVFLSYVLMLVLAELVREWVVLRTPVTDDEQVRRRRRWWALAALIAGLALVGGSVALVANGIFGKDSVVGYFGIASFVVLSTAGFALVMNDASHRAAPTTADAHAAISPFMKTSVLLLGLGMVTMVGWLQYDAWQSTGRVPEGVVIRMSIALIVALVFTFGIWREIDRRADLYTPAAEEGING